MTTELIGTISRYCRCGDLDEIEVTWDDVNAGYVLHYCGRTGGHVEVELDFDALQELGISQMVGVEDVTTPDEETEPDDLDDCPECGNKGVEVIDASRCQDTGALLTHTRCLGCGHEVMA